MVHQNQLLRVCLDEKGALVADPHRQLGGRGAWIHPRLECFSKASTRSQFSRAFRRPVTDTDQVRAVVEQLVRLEGANADQVSTHNESG